MKFKDRLSFAQYFQTFYQIGIGAEIGVYRGWHAELILSSWLGEILLIDPWEKQEDWNSHINERDLDFAYNDCRERLDNWESQCVYRRMTSEEAAKLVPDISLDWVYIDGQHSYEAVKLDLSLWYPKVRPGGLVSGHDYYNAKRNEVFKTNRGPRKRVEDFGVKKAVDEFIEKHGYELNLSVNADYSWWFIKR
jgi:hypothetical protein